MNDYPILEFDDSREAVIEPSKALKPIPIPECCVLPMYREVLQRLQEASRLQPIHYIRSISLEPIPIFQLQHDGRELAVVNPGLGAPFATAVLEELIAFGARRFMVCGSCGVLDGDLPVNTIVVPSAAVREEGTSYHYVPPAREIEMSPDIVNTIVSVLEKNEVGFRVGKTWTTDAIYRETRTKVVQRRAEGCLTVEMECAALLAVAQFRGVQLGQLLATGDDVSGPDWNPRSVWKEASYHDWVFWLSVEACLAL